MGIYLIQSKNLIQSKIFICAHCILSAFLIYLRCKKMIDNFKNLLKQYRIDNNLSQNDFVDIFILSNNFLLKLDTVTLSRWENGKTIPSIEKK